MCSHLEEGEGRHRCPRPRPRAQQLCDARGRYKARCSRTTHGAHTSVHTCDARGRDVELRRVDVRRRVLSSHELAAGGRLLGVRLLGGRHAPRGEDVELLREGEPPAILGSRCQQTQAQAEGEGGGFRSAGGATRRKPPPRPAPPPCRPAHPSQRPPARPQTELRAARQRGGGIADLNGGGPPRPLPTKRRPTACARGRRGRTGAGPARRPTATAPPS